MTQTLQYASLKYHQARDYLVEPGTIHERLVKAISVVAQVSLAELPGSFRAEVLGLIDAVGKETWALAEAGEHIEAQIRQMNLNQCQDCSKALVRVGDQIDRAFFTAEPA